jgi:hypothetical protein
VIKRHDPIASLKPGNIGGGIRENISDERERAALFPSESKALDGSISPV